jgi:hypothetical protein
MESHTTCCAAFVKVIIAVYFSESGLFKELRPIQIKNSPFYLGLHDCRSSRVGQLFRRISAPSPPFRVCSFFAQLAASVCRLN